MYIYIHTHIHLEYTIPSQCEFYKTEYEVTLCDKMSVFTHCKQTKQLLCSPNILTRLGENC